MCFAGRLSFFSYFFWWGELDELFLPANIFYLWKLFNLFFRFLGGFMVLGAFLGDFMLVLVFFCVFFWRVPK